MRVALNIVLLALAQTGASASTFIVTTTADNIPAPTGSLRHAIERSEANPGPDQIDFAFNAGTIALVGPLPALNDGGLTIGDLPAGPIEALPAAEPGVVVSGSGSVTTGLIVQSAGNRIGGLALVGFTEAAVDLRSGASRTAIVGCRLGSVAQPNARYGIRLAVPVGGAAADLLLAGSTLQNNGTAVSLRSEVPGPRHQIVNNQFGAPWDPPFILWGERRNDRAIEAAGAASVDILDNLLLGPGEGVRIGQGASGAVVRGNENVNRGLECVALTGSSIVTERTKQPIIEHNFFECAETGITLGPETVGAYVGDNDIGALYQDLAADGIVVDGASDSTVRHNDVYGAHGFGLVVRGTLSANNRISCNEATSLLGDLVSFTGGSAPPQLTGSGPFATSATIADPATGVVELQARDANQRFSFFGYVPTEPLQNAVDIPLPVLGLRVDKGNGGSAILHWDENGPAFEFRASRTRLGEDTSSLSATLLAGDHLVAYDVIRGDVKQLRRAAGGIDLGNVNCLADNRPPGQVAALVDLALPVAGNAFFYVVRRDTADTLRAGTYDPAICAVDAHSFSGPRRVSSGDCAP